MRVEGNLQMSIHTEETLNEAYRDVCTEIESVGTARDHEELIRNQWHAFGYLQCLMDRGLVESDKYSTLKNSLDNVVEERSKTLQKI